MSVICDWGPPAYDFGHVILVLGSMDDALETYSFYRQGTAIKASALMAYLEYPLTFAQIEASSGWIVYVQPGNYWNERVNAALAFWCTKEAFDQIRAFAEAKRANPGVYDLFSYNCLTFVIEAFAQGGVLWLSAPLLIVSIVERKTSSASSTSVLSSLIKRSRAAYLSIRDTSLLRHF